MFEYNFELQLKNINNKNNFENIFGHFYSNCYIINKNFFIEYKNLILYDNLTKNINNLINMDDIEKIISDEILKLDKNYIIKIFKKETIVNIFDEIIFLNSDSIEFKMNNDNKIFYPKDFVIINEEIYNNIIKFGDTLNMNLLKENINKISFYINNGRIILKSSKYKYLLIINKDKNLFIPEMILNFYSNEQISVFYRKFYAHKYEELINDTLIDFIYDNKNEIILILKK